MFDRSSPFVSPADTRRQPPAAASKVEFATARLRQAILSCELIPGQNVSEQEIVDRFFVGRAATRSALAHLAGEGLVEVRSRKGWRITPIAPRIIRDLAEARRGLEPLLVARPVSPEIVDKLEQIARINHALLHQVDETAIVSARRYDREFLDTLAKAGNFWVARWLRQAWDHSERVLCFLEGETRLKTPERGSLVDALRRKDAAGASACMTQAISGFEQFASAALMALPIDLSDTGRRDRKPVGSNKKASTKDQPSAVTASPTLDKKGNRHEKESNYERDN